MPQEKRKRGRPKSFKDNPEQNTNQSVDRAFDILEILATTPGLSMTDIADRVRMSPATAYRILNTLQKRRLTDLDPENQTWHVGSELFRLGSAFLNRSSLVERARPVMRNLMEVTGETANIGIEREGEILFLSQVETHANIRAFFQPGARAPLHASGIGKALLSRFDRARVDKLIPQDRLEQFTMKTIFDKTRLFEELDHINRQGWALDDEERTQGMRCIASPVIDHLGEAIGGISVSGPSARMPDEKLVAMGNAVRKAASDLSNRLGAP
ncbi:HTH-type transcriptional regulator BhcR [Phaeobacter inhibens]|uniref:HTH-type transcriptional regulator BhcR n=1 Tax=Phaeobacter inhibens TaxID=221822 RepID=UPI00076BB831|nr:HTH-type transcriptional regulator BhcR [Phaeobacter inhibens]KXF92298.1 IclR family transcriptional regulator [Phaeobacter inhibens]WHP68779.1 IclR family transcriptional regulator [Phaeobacter inhibens]